MRTDPAGWGVVKMMQRIEALESRFKSMIPMPPVDHFAEQLKEQAQAQQPVAETPETDGLHGMPVPKRSVDELLRTQEYAAPSAMGAGAGAGNLEELIRAAAAENDIDENLLRAVIKTESNFNPAATSPKGAMGLMQLMPGTARMYGVANPYDASENLNAGSRHLRMLLDSYDGNVKNALAAYNAGQKAVETYNGVPPYKETQNYVTKIMGMIGMEGRE